MGIVLVTLILGLAIAIERIIYLNMATTNTDKLVDNVEEAMSSGGVEAAKELCRNTKGPVASIFYQGLDRMDEGVDAAEKAVVAYGGVQMGLLEKNVSWLSLFIALAPMLAMGILLACGTMFPRMLLVASVINPALFDLLLVPAAVMALLTYVPALMYWRAQTHQKTADVSPLKNPLELKTALSFGALLALVMFLGKALQNWFGEAGVLALAAASGIADVDAITLSLARMSQDDVILRIAVTGIVMAAATNSLFKGGMATFIGGRKIGLRVGLPGPGGGDRVVEETAGTAGLIERPPGEDQELTERGGYA